MARPNPLPLIHLSLIASFRSIQIILRRRTKNCKHLQTQTADCTSLYSVKLTKQQTFQSNSQPSPQLQRHRMTHPPMLNRRRHHRSHCSIFSSYATTREPHAQEWLRQRKGERCDHNGSSVPRSGTPRHCLISYPVVGYHHGTVIIIQPTQWHWPNSNQTLAKPPAPHPLSNLLLL